MYSSHGDEYDTLLFKSVLCIAILCVNQLVYTYVLFRRISLHVYTYILCVWINGYTHMFYVGLLICMYACFGLVGMHACVKETLMDWLELGMHGCLLWSKKTLRERAMVWDK